MRHQPDFSVTPKRCARNPENVGYLVGQPHAEKGIFDLFFKNVDQLLYLPRGFQHLSTVVLTLTHNSNVSQMLHVLH